MPYKIFSLLFLFMAVFFLSSASYARNSSWSSKISLTYDISSKSPGSARVWINYGHALMSAERFGEAIAPFKKSLEMDPWYIESNYNLGVCYLRMKMVDEAISSFENTLRIGKTLSGGHFGQQIPSGIKTGSILSLANLYTLKGDFHSAIKNFRDIIDLGHENPGIFFNLALAYKGAGMIDEARQAFGKVIELNPTDMVARQQLSLLGESKAP